MKVTLNWLKEYVDFDWPPSDLAERLTMLGLEVEGVEKVGGEFEGIVVAEVLTREKHPNADKLSVCRVRDGQGERQIVCGADNFQPGDKVALIKPGASLPSKPGEKPFAIKVGRIRGVESQGMMCSPKELGLAEDAAGLLILPTEARVGQPLAEHLGQAESDVVYDLEVTPNRPDLNSVIGIAREISALTGNPLRVADPGIPAGAVQEAASDVHAGIDSYLAVRIDDSELCPRYTARVVRGVKIGPSPDWLRLTLEKVGIRAISNVVDVTNYVMLETGQPLHAFDYHLIAKGTGGKPTIVIRRASDGETFKTLDEKEHPLTRDALLIADQTKGIALAGIMGGLNTEIHDRTVDVLIESAYFKPQNIRATSKRLDLRTESSYRFERGCDVGICDWASRRAAQLILQTAGGTLVPGAIDTFPAPVEPKHLTLRPPKTNQLLGIEIPAEDQVGYLEKLGLEVVNRDEAATVTVRIPTFRVDLKREADLIEEICRLHGVDHIPATPPRGAVGANEFDAVHDQLAEARRWLVGLGLHEAQGQTLISESGASWTASDAELVRLANPLSSDMNVLRPSLLPGLLEALRHNLSRQNNDVSLFELGRVFFSNQGRPTEQRRLALALTGRRQATHWCGTDRDTKFDAFELKGILEAFFDRYGIRGVSYPRQTEPNPLFLESALILLGKQTAGSWGRLAPGLAKRLDLRDAVWLAELNLDLLLARRNPVRSFKAWPAFPSARRDVAMFVREETTHEAVTAAVRRARPRDLESVELFDVFRGQNVPPGQKSMAYAFTYRGSSQTLTDAEVNARHQAVLEALKTHVGAAVREG
jgi:phenylalanyl-tRNA synthetase beta chain